MASNLSLDEVKKVGGLELLAKQLVEGFITGLHKSPYHGFSVEFAEHRLYNEGQSTRHIDWKVFARTDRLYTKQYEEETNLRCLLVIDRSPSMFYPEGRQSKLQFAMNAAAALAYLLHTQRDAAGVCLFSEKIEELTPIKSTGTHLNKLFAILEKYSKPDTFSRKVTRVKSALDEIAEKIHRRSLVIIFSDMFDESEGLNELFKSLQHLKHNKHEVLLFHVTDHETELNFAFADRPHEFIDLESGDRLKLNPSEIKDQYESQLKQLHTELKMKCNQLKIDFISVNTKSNYFEVLQAYLNKRAKMR
jgi:uncharacterized protein (DUF58 family)